MTYFASLGLPETLLKAITKIGFTEPTPIQVKAIPFALEGRDVLGSAATGTGKTAAFLLPLIAHLIKSPTSMGLILTPTRELAIQVRAAILPFLLMHRDITTACLIGGESMVKQLTQLNKKPRIVVGTPGRINDHLVRRSLCLDLADFLVLDETDRMLDMGFGIQTEKIVAYMAKKRQTLMFSATLPPEILRLSKKHLTNPERISVDTNNQPPLKIKQELIRIQDGEKYMNLLTQLAKRQGSILIFVKTKHGADKLVKKLNFSEYHANAIHGNLQQNKRDRVMQNFRDKKSRILVATDLASRGLDICHIEHVINYDLPQCPEDYIHRIGRTARAGAEGEAVNFITQSDEIKWNAISRLINPEEAKDSPQPNNDNPDNKKRKRRNRSKNSNTTKAKESFGKKRAFSFKQHQRKGKNN